MVKGTIYQMQIVLANIYTPNTGAPNFIKQASLDIKAQIDPTQKY
jgi:hypothetical protein